MPTTANGKSGQLGRAQALLRVFQVDAALAVSLACHVTFGRARGGDIIVVFGW